MKGAFVIIMALFLLGGLVAAAEVVNVTPVYLGNMKLVAGGSNSTSFSFDYPNNGTGNYNDAPLVVRFNITNSTPVTPSVWKGDFNVKMSAEQYLLGSGSSYYYNTVPLTCSENSSVSFKAKDSSSIQYTINHVPNGTFYCYNANYYMLQLDSRDKINLTLGANIALYPGNYSFSVELMYLEPDKVTTTHTSSGGGSYGGGTFACEENWQCGNWGDCVDGIQRRTCTDENFCGTTTYEPATNRTCTPSPATVSTATYPGFFSGLTGAVIGTLGTNGTIATGFGLLILAGGLILILVSRKKK